MKIKERITLGVWIGTLGLALTWANALGDSTDPLHQTINEAEKVLQSMTESNAAIRTSVTSSTWPELEQFQSSLWRAMALDPSPGTFVPPSQVPKPLFAAELNAELVKQYEQLRQSQTPKDYRAQFEFEQYMQTAGQIIQHRKLRQFPNARAIAKRGILENHYQALNKKIAGTEAGSLTKIEQLSTLIKTIKDEANSSVKSSSDRSGAFGGGTQFIWFAILGIVGFFLGMTAYRFNPELFHKVVNDAVVGSKKASKPLDYVQWLRNFENILNRLKLSQLSNERRIEEIVMHSEKINHSAISLYTDARIKNEANLEARMANIIRDIQAQLEQGQKLQGSDRVHIQTILEHCLRLCDAVENQAVQIDHQKLSEYVNPNPQNTAQASPQRKHTAGVADQAQA